MQTHFDSLARHLFGTLGGQEQATASLAAEQSDFIRFNRGRVRQAGAVSQADLALTLVSGRRQATQTMTLSGDLADDTRLGTQALADLRAVLEHVPEDPWLTLHESNAVNAEIHASALPCAEDMVAAVCAAADRADLVAHLASGTVIRAFASSFGQRNWFERPDFALDFSLHDDGDKAVKGTFAGQTFDAARLERRMADAAQTLAIMRRPARQLEPGTYDAWLAPAAGAEVLDLLAWGGFGARAHHTRTSTLARLAAGTVRLNESVTLAEQPLGGTAPRFSPTGHPRPDRVSLISEGRMDCLLRSPRSAAEFGGEANGASNGESPDALRMSAGDLPAEQALATLGTGLAISNLWYLNYSDRNACRMTGMTRFATVWVENGQPVAPVEVMRFDDSVYDLLGAKLERLGSECEFLPDTGTYRTRSIGSVSLPGWLVRGMTLTL